MLTAKETKERFLADPTSWKLLLSEFVDDFRSERNHAAIAEPFQLSDERIDAVLAGTIETMCAELQISIPKWLHDVPACKNPYFVAEEDDLMATELVQSPAYFRIRKVFCTEEFLTSCRIKLTFV